VKLQGSAAVARNVRATPGVDLTKWPKNFDTAVYAMQNIIDLRAAQLGSNEKVGPGGLCLPRHTSEFASSCLELNASL
jgi:hypothetical protein